MQWTIEELQIEARDPLMIDETIDLETTLEARDDEILAASPAHVRGMVLYERGTVLFQGEVQLVVTLPSSRSLEPVDVPLVFTINERYVLPGESTDIVDEETLLIELTSRTIDLRHAVVDNVLTQLPIVRLTDEEQQTDQLPAGEDWQVVTEEGLHQKQHDQVDPRMLALKDLFEPSDNQADDH
ncbi:MAG: YceD family protein [Aerococcus sp.]|nr:YceD family protein [Aerococcus sp.]